MEIGGPNECLQDELDEVQRFGSTVRGFSIGTPMSSLLGSITRIWRVMVAISLLTYQTIRIIEPWKWRYRVDYICAYDMSHNRDMLDLWILRKKGRYVLGTCDLLLEFIKKPLCLVNGCDLIFSCYRRRLNQFDKVNFLLCVYNFLNVLLYLAVNTLFFLIIFFFYIMFAYI